MQLEEEHVDRAFAFGVVGPVVVRRRERDAPKLARMVAVLEGNPPWLTRGVDALASILPRLVPGRRTKLCTDLREGLHWLAAQDEPRIAPEALSQLEDAVATLRASISSARARP